MPKKKGDRADLRDAWQRASLEIRPHVHVGMTCARCEAPDCVIVPNVDPTFNKLQGVGASQHAMLCPEDCQERPWLCFRCESGSEGNVHAPYCEVAHPGYRADWDKKHDSPTMRLAVMVASRGEFLPAFIMDALFPGFTHADPPSFAAFKEAARAK